MRKLLNRATAHPLPIPSSSRPPKATAIWLTGVRSDSLRRQNYLEITRLQARPWTHRRPEHWETAGRIANMRVARAENRKRRKPRPARRPL